MSTSFSSIASEAKPSTLMIEHDSRSFIMLAMTEPIDLVVDEFRRYSHRELKRQAYR